MTRLIAAIAMVAAGAGSAAAGGRPFVSSAAPYVSGDVVACDVRCGGIFSERITGTVKSGLPAVVELIYALETRDGETVAGGVHSFELGYDVWDDVYSVAAGDSTLTFAGPGAFEKLEDAVEHPRRVVLAPAAALDPSLEYAVRLTVAVHPLTGTEKRRVEGFVDESVGARSHDTWREQVLSINELINRFFSRGREPSTQSDVFRSAYFAPGELPGSSFPVDGGGRGWPGEATVVMAWEAR